MSCFRCTETRYITEKFIWCYSNSKYFTINQADTKQNGAKEPEKKYI